MRVSAAVMALFRQYSWPGNLRQLANLLRTALILAGDESEITHAHLPDDFLEDIVPSDESRVTASAEQLAPAAQKLEDIGLSAIKQALEEAVAGLPRQPFAVIASDLDRFKAVNDTYGHAAGDSVIRAVSERLAREIGDSGMVSRTGGDEFIILIHAFTDKRRLDLLCAGIIESILKPIRMDGGEEADVGVSLGVAQAPLCGITGSAILRAADEALYAAKELGRGRAVFAAALEDPAGADPEAAPIKAAE